MLPWYKNSSERRAIRETFVSKEAPNALRMLVIERNVRPDDKHEEHYALKQAIQADWEFRFAVNDYLRVDQHNNEPMEELQQLIDRFFADI